MTERRQKRKPTDAELAILDAIWERGPSTVREVFDLLAERQEIGYTTVLKIMQIMTDKGLLERDATVRPQVFRPARPQKQTQRQLLRDLLDRAFRGSPGNLVLQALSVRKSTPEERRQIRELLDQLEREDSR
jgi:predicted transcriptional regulator